jgi:hypothetical protein
MLSELSVLLLNSTKERIIIFDTNSFSPIQTAILLQITGRNVRFARGLGEYKLLSLLLLSCIVVYNPYSCVLPNNKTLAFHPSIIINLHRDRDTLLTPVFDDTFPPLICQAKVEGPCTKRLGISAVVK